MTTGACLSFQCLFGLPVRNKTRNALMQADPDHAEGYMSRAHSLLDGLAALDASYTQTLASCVHTQFVTTHAAYGYVALRYGLTQIPIEGLSSEAEPTPSDLADIAREVKALGLGWVLVEPALSPRFAETLASEDNLQLRAIHPIESVTEQELSDFHDYMGLMQDNLDALSTALECAS